MNREVNNIKYYFINAISVNLFYYSFLLNYNFISEVKDLLEKLKELQFFIYSSKATQQIYTNWFIL